VGRERGAAQQHSRLRELVYRKCGHGSPTPRPPRRRVPGPRPSVGSRRTAVAGLPSRSTTAANTCAGTAKGWASLAGRRPLRTGGSAGPSESPAQIDGPPTVQDNHVDALPRLSVPGETYRGPGAATNGDRPPCRASGRRHSMCQSARACTYGKCTILHSLIIITSRYVRYTECARSCTEESACR
jgi:hypothetical protein